MFEWTLAKCMQGFSLHLINLEAWGKHGLGQQGRVGVLFSRVIAKTRIFDQL